ncbi:beta-lactamase family protein [Subsaximicrobium wynnwilliamsii]|uniref:Beta-lactamase family protein n=1 Tax=Subsaximicrobium wynnwilliamsii TaxID=291179 RepID=A0A5C6ZKS8_9FLAO|nr:serine hydrolase domain-containing protein [Subsaximicrobium wynnwilliamsii]TXD84533.1 beta-lactamase family protein [Subsaximicrobium wynnwilliamsii]TXD90215.1 beta-lactamase family protein [Subsaximicrobium wynnwilliamsii]TXE04266.1 beta-lactamase family protein [Subsaximicrobium wynnwilliamsii]
MKKTLLALIILSVITACEQQKEKKYNEFEIVENTKTKRLDSLFIEFRKYEEFSGNVLVAENGKIVFQNSYGLANEETNQKLNTETVFELASVSKQFTAMGIVQLHKDGKLSYNDLIDKYIPELKNYKGITIKNLLTHTSGLPDYMSVADKKWNKSQIATNDDIISLFQEFEPEQEFEPGQDYAYSNTGYLILGTIIERVSGKSFEEYLNEKIFKPLEMKETLVYRRRYEPKEVSNYAQGYIYSDSLNRRILPDENGKENFYIYLDGIVGDGMVNSNLHDLLKWDRALYTNYLINEQDKNLIFSPNKYSDSLETNYGFGWYIKKDTTYGKIVSHGGSWAGYSTYIERHLVNDKTIIILQNHGTRKIKMPYKQIQNILYDLPVDKTVRLEDKTLKRYTGIYKEENGKDVELIFREKSLWVPISATTKFPLIPISETKFRLYGFRPEVIYEFILNDKGAVESYRVILKETGVERTAKIKE